RLDGAMGRQGCRLHRVIPFLKLLAPRLALEGFFGALEPLRDLFFWGWLNVVVGKSVDIGDFQALDEHAVKACEIAGTAFEGRGMRLHPVMRRRPREMHGVLRPRAWSRGLEADLL